MMVAEPTTIKHSDVVASDIIMILRGHGEEQQRTFISANAFMSSLGHQVYFAKGTDATPYVYRGQCMNRAQAIGDRQNWHQVVT